MASKETSKAYVNVLDSLSMPEKKKARVRAEGVSFPEKEMDDEDKRWIDRQVNPPDFEEGLMLDKEEEGLRKAEEGEPGFGEAPNFDAVFMKGMPGRKPMAGGGDELEILKQKQMDGLLSPEEESRLKDLEEGEAALEPRQISGSI